MVSPESFGKENIYINCFVNDNILTVNFQIAPSLLKESSTAGLSAGSFGYVKGIIPD